ncbi:MAG: hypothetical protein CVV07_01145 [Gammaproteobacteria bacterium HGW-Gammaproteobacteria-11]|nr:MAG: hypothetical protein CVV07_01145 [Gammaproteobacteria bacterium HGW-Gammaproteobacteria-11]
MIDAALAIQAAVDALGKLRELTKKVADADLKMVVADLSVSLADAKLAAAELKGKLAVLTEENQRLREQLQVRNSDKPVFKDGLYYFGDDQHPFCTTCWDKSQQKIRLSRMAEAFRFAGEWECNSCRSAFGQNDLD